MSARITSSLGGMLGSYNPLLNLLYINIYMYCECTPDQTNKQIESTDKSSCTNNQASPAVQTIG